MNDFYTKKEINGHTFEFTITIPADNFKHSYDLLIKDYAKDTDVKGFRKGKVPADLISDQMKEVVKLETFERLAPLYINTALNKEKLEPIAPPEYKELPKILDGLDISFTITVTTMPEFKIGDIKKIKIKKDKLKIEDSEIEDAVNELRNTQKTKAKEINDDWAKEIAKVINAEEVKGLDDLKEKIRSALQMQKDRYQLHKLQDEALRKGIEISKIEIPEPAVRFEASEREKAFVQDMKNRGVKIEDFLKANNITIEKMRELWLKDAKDALEADTFLNLFSKDRKVEISDEELEKKIEEIKLSQPNADKNIFSNPQWREYIKGVERKEKGFQLFIEEVLGKEFLDEHN
ncbi:MAG TPA: trigger factor [Candidatus Dojkabacteria bacterium]|nr:trigger factor [Candidatus Dojkabacteria bacterium]